VPVDERGPAMGNAELADRMRAGLTPYLEPGEELRLVALFESRRTAMEPISRLWWVGTIDKRVILAAQGVLNGKLDQDRVFSVPKENVVVKRDFLATLLLIDSPDPKAPKKLPLMPLYGVSRDDLMKAMST
jgi:hypothetical protein